MGRRQQVISRITLASTHLERGGISRNIGVIPMAYIYIYIRIHTCICAHAVDLNAEIQRTGPCAPLAVATILILGMAGAYKKLRRLNNTDSSWQLYRACLSVTFFIFYFALH